MAFPKHCGIYATSAIRAHTIPTHARWCQRTDCCHAAHRPQAADRYPVNPPQRRHHQAARRPRRHYAPACRPQTLRPRVAGRGESGREERHSRTSPPSPAKLRHPMCRACHLHAVRGPWTAWSPAPQMHPRPHRARQPRIARHHQLVASAAADPRQVARQRRPPRYRVVAEHHAAEPPRKSRRRPPRIAEPRRVGKQPQHRHIPPRQHPTVRPRRAWARAAQSSLAQSGLDRARPSDKLSVHDRSNPFRLSRDPQRRHL